MSNRNGLGPNNKGPRTGRGLGNCRNDNSVLEGKILTIIDASIQDVEQRKAVKDLIRQTIWSN